LTLATSTFRVELPAVAFRLFFVPSHAVRPLRELHKPGKGLGAEVEYVYRHTFATRTEARLRIATWITGFYNTHRLHSVCGHHSPIDYEHDHRANSALGLAG
jgi:transposase InsO family protein